jgi:hypothetical protein
MAVLVAAFSDVVRGRVGSAAQGGALVTRRLWVASLALVVGLVIVSASPRGSHIGRDAADGSHRAVSGGTSRTGLSSLPPSAEPAVSATLGAADRSYWALGSSGELYAVSDAHGLRARFSPAGVSVTSGSSLLTLRLAAVEVSDRLRALPTVMPRARRNRVWYGRGVVSEWYVNGPLGLEQGFTIARRLVGHGGPSTLSLIAGGNLHAVLAPDRRSLSFIADGGWPALSYHGLVVSDARGRSLGAWLSLNGSRIEIQVDDRGARYPLRIDPLIQQGAKLVGTGLRGYAGQGSSVALSADGSTALVGGPADNNELGAAWVFVRSGSTWAQQGPKLVGAGAHGPQVHQGSSVALSADGSIALIGGSGDYNGPHGPNGAAWVFVRSGSTWTQQGQKLVGTGAAGYSEQGASAALSADGTTALIGGFTDDSNKGAAWVFTRSGSTWTQQGSKLVGTGAVGSSQQGSSVALSADGSTALIGGDGDDGSLGAAWVFARSESTWTQQGQKLVSSGASGTVAYQGWSVALSADGNTALIGGPHDDGGVGAAWVFSRSGFAWTQQGPKLVGGGAVAIRTITGSLGAEQGSSVALSADGSTALIGGPSDNGSLGATWLFSRSGAIWTQQGPKLVGTGATGRVRQGASVALSADGSTALIGAPTGPNNFPRGAAWVFTRSGSSWTQQGPKLVGTGATGRAQQGSSVALSADGNTALIGGFADQGGAAWVFTRSGSTWTQQGPKLVGTGATGNGWQGSSVALSADGNTALIGGPRDKGLRGAAWVFTRSGSTWTQQGPKLVGAGGSRYASEGSSVALSADGRTALIGGPGDHVGGGAVWVFVRLRSTWTQRGRKLVGTGATGHARQGSSVALSADGRTALIGGPADHGGAGAVWVFVRSRSAWTQQGRKLVGTAATGHAGQGSSLALSAAGNTALVGGPNDNHERGAVWAFTRSGSEWMQQGPRLVGTGAVSTRNSTDAGVEHAVQQGASVALSANGNTALIGGPSDNHGLGAAWLFIRSGRSWTQQGAKLVGTGAARPESSVGAGQGSSVALSASGATALTGGPYDSAGAGATWVWVSRRTPSPPRRSP